MLPEKICWVSRLVLVLVVGVLVMLVVSCSLCVVVPPPPPCLLVVLACQACGAGRSVQVSRARCRPWKRRETRPVRGDCVISLPPSRPLLKGRAPFSTGGGCLVNRSATEPSLTRTPFFVSFIPLPVPMNVRDTFKPYEFRVHVRVSNLVGGG